MRAVLAIFALCIGLVAGQAVGVQDPLVQHPTEAMETETLAVAAGTPDCPSCPDHMEDREPCVGFTSGCAPALVGLLLPVKLDARVVGPGTDVLPAERALGGLAPRVDTPPPRWMI